jgi:2-methylcitrate dehydratase PrpD
MHDPKVLELKKRVEIVADAELTKKFPAVRSAIVEINSVDGRHFKILMDRLPGAPYNPLSAAEVEEKFLLLSVPVLGTQRSQAIVDGLRNLEDWTDAASLAALLSL